MACCGALVFLFLVGSPVAVAIHAIIPAISPEAAFGVIAVGLFLLSLTAEPSEERKQDLPPMKPLHVVLAEQEQRLREDAEHRARMAEICAKYAPGTQALTDPARTAERMRIPEEVRWRVWQRDGMRCRWCGADSRLTLDHIRPVTLGGTNDEANLQTLCRSCKLP